MLADIPFNRRLVDDSQKPGAQLGSARVLNHGPLWFRLCLSRRGYRLILLSNSISGGGRLIQKANEDHAAIRDDVQRKQRFRVSPAMLSDGLR